MHIEEHNHCFMHYFGVKTLSETLFSPPLMKPGYGARSLGRAFGVAVYGTRPVECHVCFTEPFLEREPPHDPYVYTFTCEDVRG